LRGRFSVSDFDKITPHPAFFKPLCRFFRVFSCFFSKMWYFVLGTEKQIPDGGRFLAVQTK
jgi:hypothetical protein